MGSGRSRRNALQVFALTGFAVAQPILDLLGLHPEFFVVRRSEPLDVVLLVLILCLGIPAVLVLFEQAARAFGERAHAVVHAVVLALLSGAFTLLVLIRTPLAALPGPTLLVAAGLAGTVVAIAAATVAPVRTFLTVLASVVLIFPALFLLRSPVSRLVFTGDRSVAAGTPIHASVPIVFVVFDEFSVTALMDAAGGIDPARYPHFAALARDGVWFRNATAVADETTLAVPALLTGRYPHPGERELPTVDDHPESLFTLLSGAYDFRVFETQTMLCPPVLCGRQAAGPLAVRMAALLSDAIVVYLHALLPPDFRSALPSIGNRWSGFATPVSQERFDPLKRVFEEFQKDRAKVFADFVASLRPPAERPVLYFLHILLPHAPYVYEPSGKMYDADRNAGLSGARINWRRQGRVGSLGRWGRDEAVVRRAYGRYLLQVGFVDTLLGRLRARLEETGLYDPALIVVTADHGVSHAPGELRRYVTTGNYQDIMPVPLVIKWPHERRGAVSDANVELVDVLPTIAEVLGVDVPWHIDGRSLRRPTPSVGNGKRMFTNMRKFVPDASRAPWRAGLERRLALFGADTSVDDLFWTTRHGDLIGRSVASVGVTRMPQRRLELDFPTLYDRIDLTSGFVPGQIRGRFQTPANGPAEVELAVSVNATIRALTSAARDASGSIRFSVTVPVTAFRPGPNDVEVFEVEEAGATVRLVGAQWGRSVRYTLSRQPGGRELLIRSDGTEIPVRSGAVQGALEAADLEGERVMFRGWAADLATGEPARMVVVLGAERFIASSRTGLVRPDLSDAHGKTLRAGAGFELTLPVDLLGLPGDTDVRVFAVTIAGVASELAYPPTYAWRDRAPSSRKSREGVAKVSRKRREGAREGVP